jgi:deoxyadenosine/deoxycytidine kinase
MNNNNNNTIICIEANIGAGKTTLLNKLKCLNLGKPIYIIPESVDIWQNYKDENENDIFTLYYNDPSKYSFLFQNFVLNSFITNFLEYNQKYKNSILIFERSIYCIKKVFLEALYIDNKISKLEYKIFNKTFELLIKLIDNYHIQIIYLQTDPIICMERIKTRNRNGEDNISLNYLQKLHLCHENWLINNSKVKIIDGNIKNLDINNLEDLITII